MNDEDDVREVDEANRKDILDVPFAKAAHETRPVRPALGERLLRRPVAPTCKEGEEENGVAENGGRDEGDGENGRRRCEVAEVEET